MKWKDEGIILVSRAYGEANILIEIMTRQYGRRLGLVKDGRRSRRIRSIVQLGNRIEVSWFGRLEEQLGVFYLEPIDFNTARLTESSTALFGLWTLLFHLRLLPERDPYPRLYYQAISILEQLDNLYESSKHIAYFELSLLQELGFALDLRRCVATGVSDNLIFVSPKSGCAVSKEAGEPWKDKLLTLPEFLIKKNAMQVNWIALEQAFFLTGFFLNRYIYTPRNIEPPVERHSFLENIRKECLSRSQKEAS